MKSSMHGSAVVLLDIGFDDAQFATSPASPPLKPQSSRVLPSSCTKVRSSKSMPENINWSSTIRKSIIMSCPDPSRLNMNTSTPLPPTSRSSRVPPAPPVSRSWPSSPSRLSLPPLPISRSLPSNRRIPSLRSVPISRSSSSEPRMRFEMDAKEVVYCRPIGEGPRLTMRGRLASIVAFADGALPDGENCLDFG